MSDPITQNIIASGGAGTNIDPAANIILIVACLAGEMINLPPVSDGKQLYIRNDVMTNPCTIKFDNGTGNFILKYHMQSAAEYWYSSDTTTWSTSRIPLIFVTGDYNISSNLVEAGLTIDNSLPNYRVSLPPALVAVEYRFTAATTSSGTNEVTISSTSGPVIFGVIVAAGVTPSVTRVTGVSNVVFTTAGGPGDQIEFKSDGVSWFFTAHAGTAGGFTVN